VSGRLIVDEPARLRPGMRIGWAPALEDAARLSPPGPERGTPSSHSARATSTRAAPLILEALA
jgi:hypothetical protein